MTFDFNAVKEWIWDKFAEVSAKIKLRKKLNEIEELAENAGKAVRSGWKRFFTKKPAKQVIYKKRTNPFAVILGVLGGAAALFTVLVSVFYLFFSLVHGKKKSGYVSVRR